MKPSRSIYPDGEQLRAFFRGEVKRVEDAFNARAQDYGLRGMVSNSTVSLILKGRPVNEEVVGAFEAFTRDVMRRPQEFWKLDVLDAMGQFDATKLADEGNLVWWYSTLHLGDLDVLPLATFQCLKGRTLNEERRLMIGEAFEAWHRKLLAVFEQVAEDQAAMEALEAERDLAEALKDPKHAPRVYRLGGRDVRKPHRGLAYLVRGLTQEGKTTDEIRHVVARAIYLERADFSVIPAVSPPAIGYADPADWGPWLRDADKALEQMREIGSDAPDEPWLGRYHVEETVHKAVDLWHVGRQDFMWNSATRFYEPATERELIAIAGDSRPLYAGWTEPTKEQAHDFRLRGPSDRKVAPPRRDQVEMLKRHLAERYNPSDAMSLKRAEKERAEATIAWLDEKEREWAEHVARLDAWAEANGGWEDVVIQREPEAWWAERRAQLLGHAVAAE